MRPVLHALRHAVITASATLALVAGLAVSGAPAASANVDCWVQAALPSRIAIQRAYTEIPVGLRDSCGTAVYAAFDVYGPQGFDDIFIFDGNSTDYLDLYDWHTVGSFKTRDSYGRDSEFNDIPARETSFQIKFGSRAYASVKRLSSSRVQVIGKATSYTPSAGTFIPWNAPDAILQYKSGDTWRNLARLYLRGGTASYTYTTSSKRTYRFVTADIGHRFGNVSAGATG